MENKVAELERRLADLERKFNVYVFSESAELGGGVVRREEHTRNISGTFTVKDGAGVNKNVTVFEGHVQNWEV